MKTISFKRSYVAYLDILGFRSIVYSADSASKIQDILSAVNDSLQIATADVERFLFSKSPIELTVISDSIILTIDESGSDWGKRAMALRKLLHVVSEIQFNCCLRNVWLRGAITFGEVFHVESSIFGKAYIEAYELEKQAVYPRVVVSPDVISSLSSGVTTAGELKEKINRPYGSSEFSRQYLYNSNHGASSIFRDDVPFFVHYFESFRRVRNREEQRKIFNNLVEKTRSLELKDYPKFKWVAEYALVCSGSSDFELI